MLIKIYPQFMNFCTKLGVFVRLGRKGLPGTNTQAYYKNVNYGPNKFYNIGPWSCFRHERLFKLLSLVHFLCTFQIKKGFDCQVESPLEQNTVTKEQNHSIWWRRRLDPMLRLKFCVIKIFEYSAGVYVTDRHLHPSLIFDHGYRGYPYR